ncbi:hypothetical protein BpHYR1_012675 [Brachionus plicatilis]|uniref:Uncharacterized protein n=1 Tax=Brachionus plicatilis TaxID=10195 RepID=A0A3M7Q6Z9_BRAPC|nr:hypothetical protein BpHYR1_012675 [Brachionus plicatilis]
MFLFIFSLLFFENKAYRAKDNKFNMSSMLDSKQRCQQILQFTEGYRIYYPLSIFTAQIFFSNYDKNSQILLDCFTKEIAIIVMTFIPRRPIFLDNDLKMNLSSYLSSNIQINFLFYKGIVFDLGSFEFFSQNKILVYATFFYSNFGFEYAHNKICSYSQNIIFPKVKYLSYSITTRYARHTCPMMFYKCDIIELDLSGLSDTIIKNNHLSFYQMSHDLDSRIEQVNLKVYQSILNRNILDANIFGRMEKLSIYGKLMSIDKNTFKNLSKIKFINFFIDNIDMFLFESFEWLDTINSNFNISEVGIYLENYDYPQADLCLFKNFPPNRKFLFDFYGINCSCTILWLYKIYYYQDGLEILNKTGKCDNLSWLNSTCKLDFVFCPQQLKNTKKYQLTIIDIFYLSEYLNFFSFIFFPFFSLIGLITNLINMIILLSLKFSSDQILVKFMLLNSMLNLVYCLIYFFHLANSCVGLNGIVCPYYSRWISVQLYEIYVVDFLGGMLKTLSNILNCP